MNRSAAARLSLVESTPEVLVVGAAGPARRRFSERAAQRADVRLRHVTDVEQARAVLSDLSEPPRALLLEGGGDVASFVEWLRGQGRLFSVPVLLVVPRPTEAAFAEAHALGADDVVLASDQGGLTRRLARLAEFDPSARPATTMGRALLLLADHGRRRVLGRVLRMAGFEVDFAETAEEARRVAERGEPPALLVVGEQASEGSDPVASAGALREALHAPELPAVLLCRGREQLQACRRRAWGLPSMAAVPHRGPADDLLFVANELLRPGVRELRASDRLLHGTLCAFRPAGVFEHGYGLTYNLSREGMFVRTLDPPPPGRGLWVELRPPGCAEAVHLRAQLVWAKGLGGQGGAAPPGFGLRFDEEACPRADLQRYREAYEELHARVHGEEADEAASGADESAS